MERPDPELIKAWKEEAQDYVYEKFDEELKGRASDESVDFFWFKAPIIGGAFEIEQPQLEKLSQLEDAACNAIAAQIWCRKHGPSWMLSLPVHYNLIQTARQSNNPFEAATGYFADSLQHEFYNVLEHPLPNDFLAGLLFDPRCPQRLRHNPELWAIALDLWAIAMVTPQPLVKFFDNGPFPRNCGEDQHLTAITEAELMRRKDSMPRSHLRALVRLDPDNVRAKKSLRRPRRPYTHLRPLPLAG
jgi:hypothetical protein